MPPPGFANPRLAPAGADLWVMNRWGRTAGDKPPVSGHGMGRQILLHSLFL